MIRFLEDYRLHIHTEYKLGEFVSTTLQNYDGLVIIYQLEKKNFNRIIDIYQEQIQFLTKYDISTVQTRINTIFSKCLQFATDYPEQAKEFYSKLILFIEKNRLNYLLDLVIAYRELAELKHPVDKQQQPFKIITADSLSNSKRLLDLNQRIFDYKQKAKNYFDDNRLDKTIKVYREELLPFLLENHARDDEQIATCYRQMALLYYQENEKNARQVLDYYQKAIDIYERQVDDFYTEYAFQLNPNVCRRYAETLFKCYHFMATIYTALHDQNTADIYKRKAFHIYEKHADQFCFNANPITNLITIERRPFVELSY